MDMPRIKHEVFPAIAPERFAAQMAVFDRMRETNLAAYAMRRAASEHNRAPLRKGARL